MGIHILCIVVGGRSSEDGGQTYVKYVRGQQTRYDNRWVVPGALKMQDLKMTDLDISKLAHKTCMASKANVN